MRLSWFDVFILVSGLQPPGQLPSAQLPPRTTST